MESYSTAVSADGSIVAGYGTSSDGSPNIYEAFRWTEQDGMVGLGHLSQHTFNYKFSKATATSANGSIIIGLSSNSDGVQDWREAFRWSAEDGMIGLGYLNSQTNGSRDSNAVGISSDGSVVVGRSSNSDGTDDWDEAFRWTADGGMVGLGYLNQFTYGGRRSEAVAISSDGSVVVGRSSNSDGGNDWDEAFRWTAAGGMVGLGYLNEHTTGYRYSGARAISANGSAIIGASSNSDGNADWSEPFRWTASSGLIGLGRLQGATGGAGATSLSADGSVVVGWSSTDQNGDFADFRWSEDAGMQSVAEWIGPDVDLTGLFLGYRNGFTTELIFVSADGKTVSGSLWHENGPPTAYVARAGGLIVPEAAANSFGEIAALAASLGSAIDTSLGNAEDTVRHLQCRATDGRPTPYCVFGSVEAGGTIGSSDSQFLSGIGNIGVAAQTLDGWSVGARIGGSYLSSDLVLGGSANVRRFETGLQLAYVPEIGPQLALSAVASTLSASVDRRYMNGAGTTVSGGDTDGWGAGARALLGWSFATPVGRLTPYGSYSVSRIHLDGWTENSGPFPARFNDVTDTLQITRLGVEDEVQVSQQTAIWGNLAWAHRFGNDDMISGELIDLFEVGLPIRSENADWLEATAGIRYAVGDATDIAASVTVAAFTNSETIASGRLTFTRGF